MVESSHVAIVVPAYNEARTITDVLRALHQHGFQRIVVVDDGSRDGTGEIAHREGAIVVRHLFNLGFGGALGTGIAAALRLRPDIIVTCDADGQHDPGDIAPLIRPIERGEADVAIGSRLINPEGMPWSRRLANRIANLVTFVLLGVRANDSQSGLRAFSRAAASRIHIATTGMEASSEIIAEIGRNRLRLAEVPIRAIYTAYSLSKGQSFTVGLRTLAKLILATVRRRS